MPSFRVTITHTVDVEDVEALVRAGAESWAASAGGWLVRFGEDGGHETTADEMTSVVPTPEAALAWVVGDHGLPPLAGVRGTSTSVEVEPVTAS